MSIQEMKEFLDLCAEGETTIPARLEILASKLEGLQKEMKRLQDSIDYVKWKQNYYHDVLAGKVEYRSNVMPPRSK